VDPMTRLSSEIWKVETKTEDEATKKLGVTVQCCRRAVKEQQLRNETL
jgi:DNA-directed RNA polymerase subunit N (RpoN/RPB10)